jgi:hypothetical protein
MSHNPISGFAGDRLRQERNQKASSRVGSKMRPALLLIAACSSASSAPSIAPAGSVQATPAETSSPAGSSAPATAQIAPPIGDPAARGTVIAVHIVTAVGDAPATDRPAYARRDQTVTLYAAIEVEDGTRTIYSDAPALELRGKRVTAQPLAQAPRIALAWNRIEPTEANISNGDGPTFHFETIEYRATAIAGSTNQSAIPADVRPTLITDHGGGVGTMRFQLAITQGDRVLTTAGIDARRGRGSGGLTDAVTRVSIRSDDSYLGYLTEMYGQPYIWASAGLTEKSHQSERLEGSDCADFIVYGARRMGANIPYMWTGALPTVTKLLAPGGTRGEDGVYRDARGAALPFTRVGDLVLFPRHVGVLTEDRGELGVLDDQDLMMHTLFDSPKQQAIADSGYADRPVEVRRFKQDLRRDR